MKHGSHSHNALPTVAVSSSESQTKSVETAVPETGESNYSGEMECSITEQRTLFGLFITVFHFWVNPVQVMLRLIGMKSAVGNWIPPDCSETTQLILLTKCVLVLAGELMNLHPALSACRSIHQAALPNSDKCVFFFLPLADQCSLLIRPWIYPTCFY